MPSASFTGSHCAHCDRDGPSSFSQSGRVVPAPAGGERLAPRPGGAPTPCWAGFQLPGRIYQLCHCHRPAEQLCSSARRGLPRSRSLAANRHCCQGAAARSQVREGCRRGHCQGGRGVGPTGGSGTGGSSAKPCLPTATSCQINFATWKCWNHPRLVLQITINRPEKRNAFTPRTGVLTPLAECSIFLPTLQSCAGSLQPEDVRQRQRGHLGHTKIDDLPLQICHCRLAAPHHEPARHANSRSQLASLASPPRPCMQSWRCPGALRMLGRTQRSA